MNDYPTYPFLERFLLARGYTDIQINVDTCQFFYEAWRDEQPHLRHLSLPLLYRAMHPTKEDLEAYA